MCGYNDQVMWMIPNTQSLLYLQGLVGAVLAFHRHALAPLDRVHTRHHGLDEFVERRVALEVEVVPGVEPI